MSDLVHGVAYTLPGLAMGALAVAFRAAGHRAATAATAPAWARRYYRVTTALLFLTAAALLALGVGLAVALLRR